MKWSCEYVCVCKRQMQLLIVVVDIVVVVVGGGGGVAKQHLMLVDAWTHTHMHLHSMFIHFLSLKFWSETLFFSILSLLIHLILSLQHWFVATDHAISKRNVFFCCRCRCWRYFGIKGTLHDCKRTVLVHQPSSISTKIQKDLVCNLSRQLFVCVCVLVILYNNWFASAIHLISLLCIWRRGRNWIVADDAVFSCLLVSYINHRSLMQTLIFSFSNVHVHVVWSIVKRSIWSFILWNDDVKWKTHGILCQR